MSVNRRPNILYIMCDQLRFDALRCHGNPIVQTPSFDRLLRRGLDFTNAYSSCPVCVPARMTIRTGCDNARTGIYENEQPLPMDGQPAAMADRCGPPLAAVLRAAGYRAFGIGKFHNLPDPYENLGYDVQLHTEEIFVRSRPNQDAFAAFLAREHPEYAHVEQLHGERTEMYYQPQTSPLPAELTVERFVADRVCEQLADPDPRPYFGFVSFIGPHPPCAPPIPFNRLYNPDDIPNPVRGAPATDLMDEQIVFMNHAIWADELNDFAARLVKARYYGEVTYIDDCLGRILDAVEARPDADDTLIAFFSDHGDHLGDHHAWQKESFFEASCHVPFAVSYPRRLRPGEDRSLVCLTDLFGLAACAAGVPELRDGHALWEQLTAGGPAREALFTTYGRPGTPRFKCMARQGDEKYIFLANGGGEQLFDLAADPHELHNLAAARPDRTGALRAWAARQCARDGLRAAVRDGDFLSFPYTPRPPERIRQFGIPENDFGVR